MPARLQQATHKIVGAKQTVKALQAGTVQVVFVATDADGRLLAPIYELCRRESVELVEVETMAELGRLCAIEVGASAAAIE